MGGYGLNGLFSLLSWWIIQNHDRKTGRIPKKPRPNIFHKVKVKPKEIIIRLDYYSNNIISGVINC